MTEAARHLLKATFLFLALTASLGAAQPPPSPPGSFAFPQDYPGAPAAAASGPPAAVPNAQQAAPLAADRSPPGAPEVTDPAAAAAAAAAAPVAADAPPAGAEGAAAGAPPGLAAPGAGGAAAAPGAAPGAASGPAAAAAAPAAAAAGGAQGGALLQQLTEFRSRHRKTVDGRLCAAAFVHEGQTFTDCTDTRSPEGSSGRQWCYLEVQLLGKGPRDWAFCAAPLDYNALRAFVRKEFDAVFAANEQMIEALDLEERRLQDMFSRFKTACGAGHAAVKKTTGHVESRLRRGMECLERLEDSLQELGLQDYEDEPLPDGLRGAYFANDRFRAPAAAYRNDRKIDFLFFAEGPIEGVPPFSYSIRWDGFLLAPHSGPFVFTTESDCGVRVFLNEHAVIVDRMPQPTEEEAFAFNSVPLVSPEEVSKIKKTESKKTELVAGEKYRIRLELVHSSHLKYSHPDTGVLRQARCSFSDLAALLFFEFKFNFNLQTLQTDSCGGAARRSRRLDPKLFETGFLRDGVQPFLDNKDHFLADVPLRFLGRRLLLSLHQPNMSGFSFELNGPSLLFVASPKEELLPLEAAAEGPPWRAHDTRESLTLLSGEDASGRALEATKMQIRFISFKASEEIKFKLSKTAVPFLFFAEPRRGEALSCDAEEVLLSLPGGPAFANCEATSERPGGFDCRAGLNGQHLDRSFGAWKTRGPGKKTQFRFKPLDDQLLWPSKITLSFTEDGDEETETFAMFHSNSLEKNTHKLREPVTTQYVKAEISETFVNGMDSGGSFEFLGSVCTPAWRQQQAAVAERRKCDQNLETLPEIAPVEEGLQFVAVCPPRCLGAPGGPLFGSFVFSPSSSLCAAAVFSGVCKGPPASAAAAAAAAAEEECSFRVSVGGPKTQFQKGFRNGLAAAAQGPSDFSFSLSRGPCGPPKEAAEFSLSFLFGTSKAPQGFLADDGGVRSSKNGFEYGWQRPAAVTRSAAAAEAAAAATAAEATGAAEAAAAKAAEAAAEAAAAAPTTGVVFPSPANAGCSVGAECLPNFWSLKLPSPGTYSVEVLLGLPFEFAAAAAAAPAAAAAAPAAAALHLEVNGKPLVSGVLLHQGEVYTAAAKVESREGLLLLSSLGSKSAFEDKTAIYKLSVSQQQKN
ncbi:hypothetical protein ETH_00010425 [Eimeria tenella]|uniref:PA14 domain-containing protein n=1 Tax=Eimeria tenella TaxID=5802 RepID=U6L1Y6_EIMTE|nr:hypothetical protein ETH_00010425 [Eimeria tenella]CDJ44191.1 hypothetical protein ETH_00010425 [Eimeria tenella]|eukprot:XP_013234940.1 hypothetical protein ETH_00010425 [Eimeria tenella]